MRIFNATQHPATQEQIKAGVVEVDPSTKSVLCDLLTFEEVPTREGMLERAAKIASLLSWEIVSWSIQYGDIDDDLENVMLGGAPFFMPILQEYLKAQGFHVYYAFSKRESVEQVQEDGYVKKTAVFCHKGFVRG